MFAERYRAAFESLGLPLRPKDALKSDSLENLKLEGLHLPVALREFYLVAGNEAVLNQSFNRLLAPEDVFVESGRIVFMEENQGVVYWGIKSDGMDENPIVEQGINVVGQPIEWHSEDTTCAEFLEAMLYWQASFGGGLKYPVQAGVSPDFKAKLERDFRVVGKIGEMHAFAREGCAITFLKWFDDDDSTPTWRIFAGFSKKKILTAVGKELGLVWEED
jgi:hypothetical protein